MNEQQVERVAEAMFLSENPLAASGDWDGQQRAVYENLARAAIAALGDVEPEPLAVVIADALRPHEGRMIVRWNAPTGDYAVTLEASDGEDVYRCGTDVGLTIRAAAAIANATKGGEA